SEGSVPFAQDIELTNHGFQGVGVGIRRDPSVAQTGGAGQRGLAVAAVQDRYGAIGDRIQFNRPDVIVLTMKFEVPSAHCVANDLDALIHESVALFEIETVVTKVLAPGTEARPQADAVTRDDRQ